MATEEQKKANQLRLAGVVLRGTAVGIWDMVGESASTLSPGIGEKILQVMEKEMGLEIGGEKPEEVLTEMARLFVDEFGFCGSISVVPSDRKVTMTVRQCLMANLTGKLIEDGVDPFICPYRNAGIAALKRLGAKPRTRVHFDGKDSVITFELGG